MEKNIFENDVLKHCLNLKNKDLASCDILGFSLHHASQVLHLWTWVWKRLNSISVNIYVCNAVHF